VARRIGRSERRRILAFEWLEGRILSEAMLDPEPELERIAVVGAALAELHAQDAPGLAETTRREEIGTWLALADGIAALHPPGEGRARSLARRLASLFTDDPAALRPVHGDFYARQVLVEGGKASLLDLDRAVRGDPAADLGRFLAHLERDALRGVVPPGRLERIGTALLDGYRRASGSDLPSGVEPYVAAALLSLAPDPFRFREPDWPQRIDAVLERAEAVLDKGGAAL
jgi:aminoglycoside phosphotransferase (APT) family kinase protein